MTLEGVDFSDSRPGGAALAAAGKQFCVRYVPYGGYTKGLTAAEVTDYHANGIAICLVWESTSGRLVTGGFAGGAADATVAKAAAASLGFPTDRPIYFACDRQVYATDFPAIDAYMKGVASILGLDRTGIYGQASLCTHLRGAGLASWYWQTLAWSAGVVLSWIHLYQRLNSQTINGAAVDYDTAYQADYGQWGGDMALPAITDTRGGTCTIPAGETLFAEDGKTVVGKTVGATKVPTPFGAGVLRALYFSQSTNNAGLHFAAPVAGTFVAAADCTAAVKAATDPLNAKLTAATGDLTTANSKITAAKVALGV